MSNSKGLKKNIKAHKAQKNRKMVIGAAILLVVLVTAVLAYGAAKQVAGDAQQVVVQTTKGPITLEVYPKLMPVTVGNFEKLITSNFYDGLTFHRVEDWVIQGGDPQGNGSGGPGWTIPLETKPELKNVRGAVAMARSTDPNSAGSQFYILKKDQRALDGKYAVFGKVVKGMDVVDQIVAGDKMESVRME